MEPIRQLRVRIDQDQARMLGLSSQSLASTLNATVAGATVTQVRDDIYLVDVLARATADQRVSVETLQNLQVPLPSGRTVALSQFATFSYEQELPLVWRRDRVPTLTVRADVREGVLPEPSSRTLHPPSPHSTRGSGGPTGSSREGSRRRARSPAHR